MVNSSCKHLAIAQTIAINSSTASRRLVRSVFRAILSRVFC
jgi:hypothetical protein